ncbi:hypothetical protein AKG30_08855 [Lacticaseibacillus paracasei]|nr:hypothetical protein AKG30_08855 [Lacticaseibacillus paracasei]
MQAKHPTTMVISSFPHASGGPVQAGEWGLYRTPIKKVNHHAKKDSCHLTHCFVGWRNNRLR